MVHKRLPGGSVMHRSISFAVVLLLFVAIVGSLAPLSAQEITAAIVGTVTDPSGAPISGASVTATDTERGTVWTAKTNDAGVYNLPRVPVGNYTEIGRASCRERV